MANTVAAASKKAPSQHHVSALDRVRIVLVETSHPGNIGAAARAMKTMGLTDLVLVQPKLFPDSVATERAAGADDLLSRARVVSSLDEALVDCHQVFGASTRPRRPPMPVSEPMQLGDYFLANTQRLAVVFGCERTGLSNEQLQHCQYQLSIPASPDYSSLNLAAAVQVVCYALRHQVWQAGEVDHHMITQSDEIPASHQSLMGLQSHWESAMTQVKFLNLAHPTALLTRMRAIWQRAQLTETDINMLRGFCRAVCDGVSQSEKNTHG